MGVDYTKGLGFTVEGFDSDGSLAVQVEGIDVLYVNFSTCRPGEDQPYPVHTSQKTVLEMQIHQRAINGICSAFGAEGCSIEEIDED